MSSETFNSLIAVTRHDLKMSKEPIRVFSRDHLNDAVEAAQLRLMYRLLGHCRKEWINIEEHQFATLDVILNIEGRMDETDVNDFSIMGTLLDQWEKMNEKLYYFTDASKLMHDKCMNYLNAISLLRTEEIDLADVTAWALKHRNDDDAVYAGERKETE